ncbi:MAG: glycosyltransferase family 4 protein [Thermoplasmata archaeon]
MKNIAVLGWELPPVFSGGLGIHTMNLFTKLSNLLNITIYVPDIVMSAGQYPFNVFTINLSGYENSYGRSIEFFDLVKNYNDMIIENFNPEGIKLIHAHDWITFQAGVQLKNIYHIPLVVTVHSTEFDRSGNFNPQERIMEIEKTGIEQADKVITVSNYTKNIIVKNYSADEKKIRTIYNGVNSEIYYASRKSYSLKKKVLYFGRLTSQKGPKFFIEAALKVLGKKKDVQFIVAGEGEKMDEMVDLAGKYAGKEIIFLGFVKFHIAKYLYSDSDIFVLPAVSEPFGMTVLESMVSGTPAIISKTTGVGEALKNVLKVDFWDTDLLSEYMISIFKYESLRKLMGQNGQMEAMKFTWDEAAIKTMAVYGDFL